MVGTPLQVGNENVWNGLRSVLCLLNMSFLSSTQIPVRYFIIPHCIREELEVQKKCSL